MPDLFFWGLLLGGWFGGWFVFPVPDSSIASKKGPGAVVNCGAAELDSMMSGISLGRIAHRRSPCISATMRKTMEDTEPVIDLDELKAFFKAFNDAPKDPIAYASRFFTNYA